MLCGPALDAEESAASLELLRQVTLPNASKFLVTTGKFDAEGAAKSSNVEADYPPEPAQLQTVLRWAEGAGLTDPRFRDGYDLYCLRRIIARHGGFDHAVILRSGAAGLEARWSELKNSVEGRPFLTFGGGASGAGPSLLIDLRDERAVPLLDAACEFYLTGGVYGMDEYSLELALQTATDAIEMERTSVEHGGTGAAAVGRSTAADTAEKSLVGGEAA